MFTHFKLQNKKRSASQLSRCACNSSNSESCDPCVNTFTLAFKEPRKKKQKLSVKSTHATPKESTVKSRYTNESPTSMQLKLEKQEQRKLEKKHAAIAEQNTNHGIHTISEQESLQFTWCIGSMQPTDQPKASYIPQDYDVLEIICNWYYGEQNAN